jgi:hypothetical protein
MESDRFEDNQIGILLRDKVRKRDVTSIGIMMMSNDAAEKHIPVEIEEATLLLKKELEIKYNLGIKQITAAHEHAKECYYQFCVELYKETNFTSKPGRIENLIYLFQKLRTTYVLKRYIKDASKKFHYWYNFENLKEIRIDKKKDPWSIVYENKEQFTLDSAVEFITKHDPKSALINDVRGKLQKWIKPSVPEFKWMPYPSYLPQKYSLIEKWYEEFCKPDMEKRRALILYGGRNLGKSHFPFSLVNDPSYVVVFNSHFTNKDLENKVPKLLVLDDMTRFTRDNKQSWKNLLAGQSTAIRDAYMCTKWEYNVPCIVTTNEREVYEIFLTDPEFSDVTVCINVQDYLGPPNTFNPKLYGPMYDLENDPIARKYYSTDVSMEDSLNN